MAKQSTAAVRVFTCGLSLYTYRICVRVIKDVFTKDPQGRGMQPGKDALHLFLFHLILLIRSAFRHRPTFLYRLFGVSRFVTAPSPGSRHFAQGTDDWFNLFQDRSGRRSAGISHQDPADRLHFELSAR